MEHNIDLLNDLLKRYAGLLTHNNLKGSNALIPKIVELLTKIIPSIVMSYDKKELNAYLDEREYWLQQLDRITQAIQGKDAFTKIDVLYFETRGNLLYYKEKIKQLGITL